MTMQSLFTGIRKTTGSEEKEISLVLDVLVLRHSGDTQTEKAGRGIY